METSVSGHAAQGAFTPCAGCKYDVQGKERISELVNVGKALQCKDRCCDQGCTAKADAITHSYVGTPSGPRRKLTGGLAAEAEAPLRQPAAADPPAEVASATAAAATTGGSGAAMAAPRGGPPPPDKPQLQVQTTRVFAAGICCPMETPLIHSILDHMPGVHSVEVAVLAQTVTVQHDASLAPPAALVAALNGAMLEASLTPPRKQAKVTARWLPPWHVLAGAALLLISLLHYLAGPANAPGLEYLKYVSLGAVALCLPRIALKALVALRRMVFDIHLLMSLAAAGAIALGDYAEAAAVVVLFAVAEHWERCSTDKARDAVAAVLKLRPVTAKLASSGEAVPVEDVVIGTVVVVPPGEAVPLDGTVLTGESALEESLLTGESAPVCRGPGSTVHAGTMNVGACALLIETTSAAGETAVARMAALVEQAASEQSPAEALVSKFARIYTPIILVTCALLAFLPWAWVDTDKRSDWVYLSLQVLVTACPCALVLATPATVVCALARAAGKGVLIKSGAALEALRRVSVVSFDKTGTLTKGSFQVITCQAQPGWSRQQLLRLLGSLERGSNHPLAAAVLGYAAARGAVCDAFVDDVQSMPGLGLVGTVEGHRVAAGTAALLKKQAGVAGAEVVAAQRVIDTEGATACLVAVDGQFAGWLSARDVVRPEAAEAVTMLHKRGIKACMLTGDAAAVAAGVGAATGIPRQCVFAGLLPQDKLDKVAELKHPAAPAPDPCCPGLLPSATCCLLPKRAPRVWVAHVGDGVNDAPALAAADAGVAMGIAGSAAALEAGSVALFTHDVRAVPAALMLARAAGATIWQNVAFAVLTKVAVLVPAALGKFTLWGAVLMDVGSSLLVVLNALRLLKWRWPASKQAGSSWEKECCKSGTCATPRGPTNSPRSCCSKWCGSRCAASRCSGSICGASKCCIDGKCSSKSGGGGGRAGTNCVASKCSEGRCADGGGSCSASSSSNVCNTEKACCGSQEPKPAAPGDSGTACGTSSTTRDSNTACGTDSTKRGGCCRASESGFGSSGGGCHPQDGRISPPQAAREASCCSGGRRCSTSTSTAATMTASAPTSEGRGSCCRSASQAQDRGCCPPQHAQRSACKPPCCASGQASFSAAAPEAEAAPAIQTPGCCSGGRIKCGAAARTAAAAAPAPAAKVPACCSGGKSGAAAAAAAIKQAEASCGGGSCHAQCATPPGCCSAGTCNTGGAAAAALAVPAAKPSGCCSGGKCKGASQE